MSALEPLLWTASAVLALPASVLLAQCGLAALPGSAPAAPAGGRRPRALVLVPAHDEAAGIAPTLASLKSQLAAGDRLLVVADNCSDATARLAREAGAEVVERLDPARRGKGFALAFGLAALEAEAGDAVVVVVDADSRWQPGALEALVEAATRHQGPVQGQYLLAAPPAASPAGALSALALRVRNRVRPLGMARLGLPCPLTGCGMALPLALFRRHGPRGESVVEDLELGIDLACAGHAPHYVDAARLTSVLPEDADAAREQRRRWEHGHLYALLRGVPRLVGAGLGQRRVAPLALALDLAVPPLSLLLALETAALLAAGAAWLGLGVTAGPVLLSGAALAATLAAVTLAWLRFGRDVARGRDLLAAPLYALRKLPLYAGFLARRQRSWVRTRRDSEG